MGDSTQAQLNRNRSMAPSGSNSSSDGKVVNVQQMLWRAMSMIPRELLGRLGGQWGFKRDLYGTFGWDRFITSQDMWRMYSRGGIAKRVVHAYPDAIWGNPPEIVATQTFQKAWDQLVEDQDIWSLVHRLDRLCRIGQFSVLLVGLDDSTKLDQPASTTRDNKILYLQPYSDRSAVITKWGTDPTDSRFNLPMEYTIYPGLAMLEDQQLNQGLIHGRPIQQGSYKVHWSRIIHFSKGGLESLIFGVPDYYAIWNYLQDLQKVVGGSAESYWMTANRGMHADVDKDMELDENDEAALSSEIQEYSDGMRRFIRTRGVTVKALGEGVADPSGPFKVLVSLIGGTCKIPNRILLGSEAAHNASTQDKGNWTEAVDEERKLNSGPAFLKPLIMGFMRLRVVPTIAPGKIIATWPDAYVLSPLEEAQKANQIASAANSLGLAVKNVENLASVEELRGIIGLPAKQVGSTKPQLPAVPTAGGATAKKPGAGSGTTATPTSDANGKGEPIQAQK